MYGLLFALGLGLGAPAASPVEVIWTGDTSCSQVDFQASLAPYLVNIMVGEPLRAEVQTHRRDRGRWTLTLTLVGPDGRSVRQLRGPSCASVSRAAAFVTAVAVDPTIIERAHSPGAIETGAAGSTGAVGGEGTSGPASGGVPTEPPDAGVVPLAPAGPGAPAGPAATAAPAGSGRGTTPRGVSPANVPRVLDTADPLDRPGPTAAATETAGPRDRARRARPGGFARVAGGLETIGLPAVGGQVQVAAGPFGRAWRVELRGLYRAPSRALVPEHSKVGGQIGLWTVGAQGCGVLRPSVLEIPLCAGVEAGQARGSSFGFMGARTASIPWVAVTVAAALAWAPRRWLALWLGIEVAVPVVRGSFDIAGLGDVHRMGPISPRAALGIELRFR